MLELHDITLMALLYVLLELMAGLLVLDAVVRPRSSQAAIAWSIGLLAMPVITIPLYLVFGRTRFQGYADTIRTKTELIEDRAREWFHRIEATEGPVAEENRGIASLAKGLTGVSFTGGNATRLLVDGEATYAAMLEAMESAESYIFIQFYIVRGDGVGKRFRDTLIGKAKAGVRVCFLFDEIGSLGLSSEYLDSLKEASIQVSGFKATRGRNNRFQINFRNHRKLLIVDGRVGFIGGHNLGDEYLRYRDTHLRLTGPSVQLIQLTFLKDWYWATRELPEINTDMHPAAKGDKRVAIVNTGPADTKANCSVLFASIIHSARSRLWMTSPYFVPDSVMVRALQSAAIRGVDVRIILPNIADHLFVELASSTYYAMMMACGVRFYRYQDRFLHQKVVLVDSRLAGVGTVNLDNRALYLNFEATALVADAGFAREVESMLLEDLAECDLVPDGYFSDKPIHYRMAARISRLASPLL